MRALTAGAFVVALAVGVEGQAKADFSGTWLEDRERLTNLLTGKPVVAEQAAGGAMALRLGETVVTQTAEAVTLETKVLDSNRSLRYTYQLDGSKSVNHSGAQTRTTASRWERDRLVTVGTVFQVTSDGETSWDYRDVMYLQKGELVLEVTWAQDGKVTTSTRRVYRRAGTGS